MLGLGSQSRHYVKKANPLMVNLFTACFQFSRFLCTDEFPAHCSHPLTLASLFESIACTLNPHSQVLYVLRRFFNFIWSAKSSEKMKKHLFLRMVDSVLPIFWWGHIGTCFEDLP
jgi:hypothetical protein